jgi:hypothetical protein
MKIIIDEKAFKELFRRETVQYEYDHNFMHGHETMGDFLKTKRCHMLKSFRATLNHIKNALMEA